MIVYSKVPHGVGQNARQARIILSNGLVAGVGYGATNAEAAHDAARNAADSEDARFAIAGRHYLENYDFRAAP